MRFFVSAFILVCLAFVAPPAYAQLIAQPAAGRLLFIADNNGKVIERLQPHGNRYEVYDVHQTLLPIGYAKVLGNRMVMYDRNNNIIATMREELLPPDSPLSIITIVRDPQGHPIGLLERH